MYCESLYTKETKLATSNNEMWFHANQDYLLPILSLSMKLACNTVAKRLSHFIAFETSFRTNSSRGMPVRFTYEEGCPVLQM